MTIRRDIQSDVPTPRTALATHPSVTAYGRACEHAQPLDLAKLVAAGHEDTPLLELPLRYAVCGVRGHCVVGSGARGRPDDG